MTINNDVAAPWTLLFHRDGTEDFGVIYDASGGELVRSRFFWLPERDDPVPPTLAALHVMTAAPNLLAALIAIREEIEQLNGWWTERLATLAQSADAAIAEAKGGRP